MVPPPIVPPPPKSLAHLQVIAREWSVIPSRMTLPAGRVVVELDNLGQDPHNLRIERGNDPLSGFDFPLARAGTRATRSLELGAGIYVNTVAPEDAVAALIGHAPVSDTTVS